MSLISEQIAFLKDIRTLLAYAETQNLYATGGELERSIDMQALNVRSGKSDSMDSMHLRKCAMDLNFFKYTNDIYEWFGTLEELSDVGNQWESLDPRNKWGGHNPGASDLAHFERDIGAWPAATTFQLDPIMNPPEEIAVSTLNRPAVYAQALSNNEHPTLHQGSNDTATLKLQEKLIALKLLPMLIPSGVFDSATESAVRTFQTQSHLVADGIVGPKTWDILSASPANLPNNILWLSDADIESCAQRLSMEPALLKAVYKVESNGRGFVDGTPKTLFEGHVFWARLKAIGVNPQPLAVTNSDILYPTWTREYYGNAAQESSRLKRAQQINSSVARESASWGLFQIMGYHWQKLNYASVIDFVNHMNINEREHLNAFSTFISISTFGKQSLLDLLKAHNWSDFAYAYNGPGYRKNAYDDKLKSAYLKYKQPNNFPIKI